MFHQPIKESFTQFHISTRGTSEKVTTKLPNLFDKSGEQKHIYPQLNGYLKYQFEGQNYINKGHFSLKNLVALKTFIPF